MKSYKEWKSEKSRHKVYAEALGGGDEIKAAFDDLRETVRRASESAGVVGTVKRGLFGAARGVAGAMFGKDSRAAGAVPDVSSNYDLNRASTLGTFGRAAAGGAVDSFHRVKDELTGERAARRAGRQTEGAEGEGPLYLEWDKNALDVVMQKIDEVEKRVVGHVRGMSGGSRRTGNASWETDLPGGGAHTLGGSLPRGVAQTLQTELPPAALSKMEDKFETDPVLQAFLNSLGTSHSFTAAARVAKEQGKTPEELAEELDDKYGAGGALKGILLQKKRLTKKDVAHLGGYGHKIVKPTGETFPNSPITTHDV